MSVGKPRQSRVPAQPEALLTPSIDGPEEMGSFPITSPPVSALLRFLSRLSFGCEPGEVAEEQLLHETQAGYRCGSIIPPRVMVAHPVGYALLITTTSFMLTHVITNLFSFTPKKT